LFHTSADSFKLSKITEHFMTHNIKRSIHNKSCKIDHTTYHIFQVLQFTNISWILTVASYSTPPYTLHHKVHVADWCRIYNLSSTLLISCIIGIFSCVHRYNYDTDVHFLRLLLYKLWNSKLYRDVWNVYQITLPP